MFGHWSSVRTVSGLDTAPYPLKTLLTIDPSYRTGIPECTYFKQNTAGPVDANRFYAGLNSQPEHPN